MAWVRQAGGESDTPLCVDECVAILTAFHAVPVDSDNLSVTTAGVMAPVHDTTIL
jgi:hypothetical protein